MAHLSGIPRDISAGLAAARLDEAGLADARNRRIQGYSKGMQQRMGLAAALVHDPELLFLDEPTDGVDPVGRREIRELVVREAEAGRTVLLNSHLLSEVDQTCTRVAILNHGRLIATGPTAEVKRETLGAEDEITYRIETTEPASSALEGFPGRVEKTEDGGKILRVFLPSDGGATAAIDHLRARGIGLRAVVPLEATLEDRFIALIEQDNETRFGKRP